MHFRLMAICIIWLLCYPAIAETWKLTSLDWPPYASSKMDNGGDAIAELRQRLAGHGIELVVEYYPWQRAIKTAQKPGYLGYFPAWPEEIIDGFIASTPVAYCNIGLITLSANPLVFTDITDLFNRYRIGIVRSYTYPEAIQTAMETYSQHTTTTINENMLLTMLMLGRFDVAISDPTVLKYLTDERKKPPLVTQQILFKHPLIIGLNNSPENQAHITLLEQLLQK